MTDNSGSSAASFFPPVHQHLYALEEQFYVLLDSFEGPLDLLLFLVRKNRVAIEDLPIITVTRQYLAYLELMEEFNLSIASEYLVMAATLIQIKSRVLLRRQDAEEEDVQEPGDDPREEIIARLRAYELYKKGADYLGKQPLTGWDCFPPAPRQDPELAAAGSDGADSLAGEMVERYAVDLNDLLTAFLQLCERQKELQERLEIIHDTVDLRELCQRVEKTLTRYAPIEFSHLASRLHADRSLVVAVFFALLEMGRQQRLSLHQEEPLAALVIHHAAHGRPRIEVDD
ncbi:MAG: segregation/condensation protein A [Deltaproteobacteria bacterium]|nr:segregation/condensation protein A [Deltaproteobacteria bacterium]